MKRYRPAAIVLLALAFAAGDAWAALTGVRSTPRQAQLVGTAGNVVTITWRVSTTADHASGVMSGGSAIVDPASGAILQQSDVPLNASGAGPFALREVLSLDPRTVRSWTEQGIKRVVVQRMFFDRLTNSFATASVALVLSSSRLEAARQSAAPAELAIASLRLELDAGNNTAVVAAGESLRALLTVQHAGSGMLSGRWQIAEPESSDGVPLFRTVALVNTRLQATQESTLRSPVLPTRRGGRYLVRFCVTSSVRTEASTDAQCPDADLIATAIYHVQVVGGTSVAVVRGLSPDRQAIGDDDRFSWEPVPLAVAYQLQIFELAPAAEEPGVSAAGDLAAPAFVTGMLLDAETSDTPLSALVRSKLRPGQRYLWRVTAHDEAGRMVGSSTEASFVYRPGR